MGKRFTALLALGVAFLVAAAVPARAQTANDLFQSQSLQTLELWVNNSDWSKLLANFQLNDYYPADVTWNGQTARNVGIRSRGRGSRSGTKPGLRVDFDRYSADQTFLGNSGMNNFYLYRLENKNQHTLIAWDTDNTFWGAQFSIDTAWNKNALVDKLMSIPEYNALYLTEIKRAVELAEADGWLDAEIIKLVQRIDTAMKEDTLKPYSETTYQGSVGVMLSFARDHIAFVKCELDKGIGKCFQ